MVQVNINIAENLLTGSAAVKVDDGWHKGLIVKGEMKPSLMQGNPDDLVLTHVITEGKFAHTELERRFSIQDTRPINSAKPEWTWQKAAYANLAKLADALGVEGVLTNTDVLCNKPVMFSTVTKQGKDRETGAHKPEWDRSDVRDYKAVAGFVSPPVAANAQSAAPTTHAQVKKPW